MPINHKQLPMYKTIFMMIYGSGLRISEATNIRIEDIDSNNMRLFVRNKTLYLN